MAHVRIIAVGKLKEAYFQQAQAEYLKRLGSYLKLELIELPDLPCPDGASAAQEEQVRRKEGLQIRNVLQPRDFVVVFDREGKEVSSVELAGFLQERELAGSSLALIVGGSLGVSKDLLELANLKLSFSRLTFPHQLFRVILLEQLYRACKINRGEKYHK